MIGGRILATALAAAILNDPANATVKTAARAQALSYFGPGITADAHRADPTDAYASRAANERIVTPKLTYGLPRGRSNAEMVVPTGAEVLLETRQPYLTAAQRREVLRTTALGAGWPLLDGTEFWGRLNLFAAADGYGAFDRDVVVTLDGTAADAWRNDIDGRGGLIKRGTGTLTLTGHNSYRGGTTVAAGTLAAASRTALGCGDVLLTGGTLQAADLTVNGDYRQQTGTLIARGGHLDVRGDAVLGTQSVLEVHGETVLRARRVSGKFGKVVAPAGYQATVTYTRTTVTVRLRRG
ncbi:autotransporter-associated beta strand repeat-containing protein [Paractinoplanes durhamensis]|uniref:autotransporter-associated beta strand repeat-containing protein n=1 Tax=Paractinoplanes durhamensis TaxID=113563 RepID=UPI0036438C0B